ncbi:hypothetical protein GM415_10455 [Pseudodesulfovibrio cashew]|uniref:Uncharacterized protein n=1 Tax=Pseudodesulfovibrio cashew TaxID=2678688 RepID=A0A6I6JCK5_9BACT|nr:DUF6731 family protein [Pseudodesulfovibrio cashew]QGY40526.1 hypothetical protein GM415_10455 [Pseudodesulfovibrio cashew]
MKAVKFDFYRVHFPDEDGLEDALADIIGLDYPDRTCDINGCPVCLDALENGRRNLIDGLLVKVRMDGIPPKKNITTGASSSIDLDEDEGLGEDTAFVYDPTLNVLVMQRNRMGVTASQFARYLYDQYDLDEWVRLDPILVSGAYQRLAQLGVFRKLRVRVAPLGNNNVFRDQGHSVNRLVDLAEQFEAPVIDVTIGMGHQRQGSLSGNAIRRTIEELTGIRGERNGAVTRIEVTGKDDDDSESCFIDLIEERMVEEAMVPLNEDRQLDVGGRVGAAYDALRRRRVELRGLLEELG